MTDAELKILTLAQAIRMISQKQISAAELAASVLARIERLNGDMRAFITVMRGEDVRNAKPPLFGVPLSVKDLYDTESVRTTAGSPIFADRIPQADATAVAKLKAAGATIVGKTNMHEWAFGLTTINPHYGTARNPWDRD